MSMESGLRQAKRFMLHLQHDLLITICPRTESEEHSAMTSVKSSFVSLVPPVIHEILLIECADFPESGGAFADDVGLCVPHSHISSFVK